MNITEVCLGGNWVCARYETWRFPGKFPRSILVGRCSGVLGWKLLDGPRLSNLDGPVAVEWNGKELGARDGGFLGNFQSDLGSVKWKDVWLENTDGPQIGYVLQVFVGNLNGTQLGDSGGVLVGN